MNRRNFFAVLAGAIASIPMLGKARPTYIVYPDMDLGKCDFGLPGSQGYNFYDLNGPAFPIYPEFGFDRYKSFTEWTPEELEQ